MHIYRTSQRGDRMRQALKLLVTMCLGCVWSCSFQTPVTVSRCYAAPVGNDSLAGHVYITLVNESMERVAYAVLDVSGNAADGVKVAIRRTIQPHGTISVSHLVESDEYQSSLKSGRSIARFVQPSVSVSRETTRPDLITEGVKGLTHAIQTHGSRSRGLCQGNAPTVLGCRQGPNPRRIRTCLRDRTGGALPSRADLLIASSRLAKAARLRSAARSQTRS